MSNIKVAIDKIVLHGVPPADHQALVEGLRQELSRVLGGRAARGQWGHSHGKPVMKLGSLALAPGPGGSKAFGRRVATAIGRGLRP